MSHKAAEEGDLNGGEPGDEGEPAGAAANKNNEVNDEIRSGQGEFLAERQPGGRVKLEEVNQAKQDGAKAMDAPLLKAAQDTANNEVVKKTDEGADEAVVDLPKAAKEISNEAENADDKNL
uniref:Uncharacterized protein n=1 Tax=Ditylenchus dipsaci TaxID=166011 RepID=A0A915E4Q8_9BILA